jgi:3-oxoacyl-[acyl-carrier protein] reductase
LPTAAKAPLSFVRWPQGGQLPARRETDMSSFTKTEAGRTFTLGLQSLKRIAQPDDLGGVVAFLASDEARWITGDTIHVDGGSKL